MSEVVLGVIGGSGLYDIEGFNSLEEVKLETPFGAPSDAFIVGELEGVRCVFVPRHGRGHRFTPSEVNYRANIWGLKKLGVQNVLSVSAVGSLKVEIEPGHLVCVDQFVDRTRGRVESFFGDGVVGHVQFGDPVEEAFRQVVLTAAGEAGATVHDGGAYVCIEGPTFSTRAESNIYRSWGASVVGMTNVPEARLAREAELGYTTLALCTDYDCWHEGHDEVSVETVIATIHKNVASAKDVIRLVCRQMAALGPVEWPAHNALAKGMAIMTAKALITDEARARLDLLIGEYI
jgi:5'-methylthioadenosine phosphorylase